jgi:hypothetical protein
MLRFRTCDRFGSCVTKGEKKRWDIGVNIAKTEEALLLSVFRSFDPGFCLGMVKRTIDDQHRKGSFAEEYGR